MDHPANLYNNSRNNNLPAHESLLQRSNSSRKRSPTDSTIASSSSVECGSVDSRRSFSKQVRFQDDNPTTRSGSIRRSTRNDDMDPTTAHDPPLPSPPKSSLSPPTTTRVGHEHSDRSDNSSPATNHPPQQSTTLPLARPVKEDTTSHPPASQATADSRNNSATSSSQQQQQREALHLKRKIGKKLLLLDQYQRRQHQIPSDPPSHANYTETQDRLQQVRQQGPDTTHSEANVLSSSGSQDEKSDGITNEEEELNNDVLIRGGVPKRRTLSILERVEALQQQQQQQATVAARKSQAKRTEPASTPTPPTASTTTATTTMPVALQVEYAEDVDELTSTPTSPVTNALVLGTVALVLLVGLILIFVL